MKTVVITGGCSGIGLATAKAFLQDGCRVYALDTHAPTSPVPEHFHHVPADITDAASVEEAAASVPGPIDVLFNNAGIMRRGTLFDSTEGEFDALFAGHVKGPGLVAKALVPQPAPDALVLQMSSVHALRESTDPALYTLVKQTAMHFAQILRKTYPHLRVKLLFPGPTDTQLSRHGVTGKALEEKEKIMHTPDELAAQILRFSKSDAERMTYRDEHRDYVLE